MSGAALTLLPNWLIIAVNEPEKLPEVRQIALLMSSYAVAGA
jgi:hypothetical protein